MIKKQQLNEQTSPTSMLEEKRTKLNSTIKDEIKDYAKTTMNELLGRYRLDEFDNRQTNGLNLTNYICGLNQNNGVKKCKVNCSKWMGKQSDAVKPLSRSSSPFLSTNYQSNHLNEESMGLSGTSSVPVCSNSIGVFNGEEDEDSGGHILCAWCQKIGSKVFSLRTTNGFKAFCSELCFAQCRRASFKKNKVCDWCKHVRHTVNYVDFQNGEQSLQFCSDKCLNQYKMNIFCRETQAHLNAFSAVYRSPSPPKSYHNPGNIFRSSNDLSECDKDNSKETEISSIAPDLWLRNSSFHQMATSTSSQSSSLSSSPSPTSTLESICVPASSLASHSQQSTFHQPIEKCSKEIRDIKPTLSTYQFQSKDRSQQTESATKKPLAKFKIVGNSREKNHKSKSGSILKPASGNKQRSSKIHRNLSNNQENILDLNTQGFENTNELSNVDAVPCSTTPSNHSVPFSTRFSHNPQINHLIEDKNLESAINCSPTFINLPNPPVRMPQFPHPHQFFHPLRPDFLRLRQSLPMFPFNQQNLFRLPGHHRPSFPPIPAHHPPFSHPHLPDHQSSQSPVPLQFQPSSMMGQSIANNSFNYPGSLSIPVAHPFLLPLPMPIPLPIPFPIRFNSSPSLKSLISTEDKEVQVGISQELFSQFTCNSRQDNDTINDVDPRKTIINNLERENQTRFRIDTLMNKLIDKRMRAMSEPNDQELTKVHSDCNTLNLKRTKIEKSTEPGINSGVDSKISNDYHDDSRSSCFLKAKRFKQDILSI